MTTPGLGIAELDLRLRRRSTIGYAVGMAVYTFVVVALYPAMRNDTGLDQLTQSNPTFAALFGATGSLTSPSGWVNVNIYANFLPLVILVLTMGYGAASIAGQDEDGTLGSLAALPVSRTQILTQKLLALLVQAVPVALLTAAFVVVGRGFQLQVGLGALTGATIGALLMGLDFGILAMLLGAWTGSRGLALGVTSGLAAASYLVSSLAPVSSWIRPLRFGSLFYYSVGNGQLTGGLSWGSVGVLVAVGAVLTALTFRTFARLDVH